MSLILFLPALLGVQSVAQELLQNPRCNHYPDRGTCETSFEVKWYYDRFDHRCKKFFYGGCHGNENRFNSLQECDQTCHFDPQAAESNGKRCFLPHDPGNCWGNFERWYFDASLGRCICSWWSGCGGNANRYYSYPHCMQICGEYARHGQSSMEPDVTVYEAPHQRHSIPIPSTSAPYPLIENRPPPPFVARPKQTLPLGGSVLYQSHVSTPVHPPIYDDPDIFQIDPVLEDFLEATDEPDHSIPESDALGEWSAKTETRVFPDMPVPVKSDLNLKPPSDFAASAGTGQKREMEVVETQYRSQRASHKPTLTQTEVTEQRALRPALSGHQEREQAETDFQRPSRIRTPKNVNYEIHETPNTANTADQPQIGYSVVRPLAHDRKPVAEAPTVPPVPSLTPIRAAGGRKTKYAEYAETPFLRHTYINPPVFPGYPLLRSVDQKSAAVIPQPVPLSIVNQLIRQHMALRNRFGSFAAPENGHRIEVRETPFRRKTLQAPNRSLLTYEEKRRRWKEEMKRRFRARKVPARQLRPVAGAVDRNNSNKVYVTFSPRYNLYQVSRQPPAAFDRGNSSQIKETPPPTTPVALAASEVPQEPTEIRVPAEEVPLPGPSVRVRVSAVKPVNTNQVKQLLYIDDEEDWKVEGEDVDESTAEDVRGTEEGVPSDGMHAIVFPPKGNNVQAPSEQSPNHSRHEEPEKPSEVPTLPPRPPTTTTTTPPPSLPLGAVTGDSDYVLPSEDNAREDYFDYGQSEEDLFFWKPEYEQRRSMERVRPTPVSQEQFDSGDAFEITVHNAQRKL